MMQWRTIGMIALVAACGPTAGADDVVGGSSDSGTTADDPSTTSASSTTTSSTTSSTTSEESSSEETGAQLGRCVSATAIDTGLPNPSYAGAARLLADQPARLVFATSDEPPRTTSIVGVDAVADAWAPVQIIEGVSPLAFADIDGDARDDAVLFADVPQWWSPDASGALALQGPIDMTNQDALVTRTGQSVAALLHSAGGDLEIRPGNGDGTFAPPLIVPPFEDGFVFDEWVRDASFGVVSSARWKTDCFDFCVDGGWLFTLEDAGATLLASIPTTESFLALGDFDADGTIDAFVQRDDEVHVRRGPAYDFSEPLIAENELVQFADFDGDGATDVIVSNEGWIGVYWNDGGALPSEPEVLDGITLAATVLAKPTDVDGDGASEVVIGDYSDDTAWELLRFVPCE